MFKNALKIVLLLAVVSILGACGDNKGITTLGKTVFIDAPTVTTPSNVVIGTTNSDVKTSLSVTSKPYPNFDSQTASAVTIKQVRITYTKTGTSGPSAPVIADQFGATGSIPRGAGSISLEANVASLALQNKLINESSFLTLDPPEVWEYYLHYYVTAVEDSTGNDLNFNLDGGRITFTR